MGIDQVISFITDYGWWIAIPVVLLIIRYRAISQVLDDPQDGDFENYRQQLGSDRYIEVYHRLIKRWILNPLERWIGDKQETEISPNGWSQRWLGVYPWTSGAYRFTLTLAFIYPLFSVLFVWLLGEDGRLGNLILLEQEGVLKRLMLVVVAVSGVLLWRKGYLSQGNLWPFVFTALGAIGISATVFYSGSLALAVLVVSIASVIPNSDHKDSFLVAAPAALTFAFIVALGLVFMPFSGAAAGGIIFAIAFILSLSVALLTDWLSRRLLDLKKRILVWLLYSLIMLLALGLAISVFESAEIESNIILVFLVMLPILNAFWDWVSLGISRGLLSAIVSRHHGGGGALLWAVMDLVFAVVFLFAIIITVFAALGLLNRVSLASPSGLLVFDPASLFSSIRNSPWELEYSWVYFMFFSTLLPTLVHFSAASTAFIQWIHWGLLRTWRLGAARDLETHGAKRLYAKIYLTLVPAVGFLAPILALWLLYLLLVAHGGAVGYWLLDLAEVVYIWAAGPAA